MQLEESKMLLLRNSEICLYELTLLQKQPHSLFCQFLYYNLFNRIDS